MSEYFDQSVDRVSDGITARAADVNNLRDAVGAGFDKLPSEANIKRGTINFALDTGIVSELIVDLPHAPSAYVNGLEVVTIPAFTGPPSTINVNSLGVKVIRDRNNNAVTNAYAGVPLVLRYSEVTGFFHTP